MKLLLSLIIFLMGSYSFACPVFEFKNLNCIEKLGDQAEAEWKFDLVKMSKSADKRKSILVIVDSEGNGQMEFPYRETGENGEIYNQFCESGNLVFTDQYRYVQTKRVMTINESGFVLNGEFLFVSKDCESGDCKINIEKKKFNLSCSQ